MARRSFNESALKAFLIARPFGRRKGLFRSAKELSLRLAELPQALYPKPKSTEAFLSQIFKGRALIPDQLREEILRYLISQPSGNYDEVLGDQFRQIIDAHNKTITQRSLTQSAWELLADFKLFASRYECAEHFVLTSQAAIERNNEVFSFLLLIQAAALRLVASEHSGFGIIANLTAEADYKPIWVRAIDDVSYSYIVESKRSAFLLWQGLFKYVCLEIASNTDEYLRAISGGHGIPDNYLNSLVSDATKKEAAERLRSSDQVKRQFQIFVIEEPLNALCASSVVAINPRLAEEIIVYSLADNWTPKFSENESRSWRQLVHSSKAEFLKDAYLCRWIDVEATVIKEPIPGDWCNDNLPFSA